MLALSFLQGRRLFSGDESGLVLLSFVHQIEPSFGLLGFSSLLTSDLVWTLDGPVRSLGRVDASRVVQLDVQTDHLLVSSLTRVLVLDLTKPADKPKQVGSTEKELCCSCAQY